MTIEINTQYKVSNKLVSLLKQDAAGLFLISTSEIGGGKPVHIVVAPKELAARILQKYEIQFPREIKAGAANRYATFKPLA